MTEQKNRMLSYLRRLGLQATGSVVYVNSEIDRRFMTYVVPDFLHEFRQLNTNLKRLIELLEGKTEAKPYSGSAQATIIGIPPTLTVNNPIPDRHEVRC